MEKQDMLGGSAENTKTASGTTTATATQAAPGAGQQLIVTGFSISQGAISSAAGTFQIRRNGGAIVMRQGNLPNAALISPIVYEFKRPLVCGDNQDADIIISGWTGATVVIELYTVTRPTSSNQITPAAA